VPCLVDEFPEARARFQRLEDCKIKGKTEESVKAKEEEGCFRGYSVLFHNLVLKLESFTLPERIDPGPGYSILSTVRFLTRKQGEGQTVPLFRCE